MPRSAPAPTASPRFAAPGKANVKQLVRSDWIWSSEASRLVAPREGGWGAGLQFVFRLFNLPLVALGAMSVSRLLGRVFGAGFFAGFDAVAVGGPGAEIDALAARRAKRPVTVFGDPFDRRAAARTGDDAGYRRLYRLQSVSSKLTVESTWRGL